MNGAPIEEDKFKQVVRAMTPGSILLRTWSLQGGISAEMTAFELGQPDGQKSKVILRRPSQSTFWRNPRAAEDEFKILQLTKSLGFATPTAYFLDQTGAIFPRPYLLIEYIEGKPEFQATPGTDFTDQLAEHLAKIHSGNCSNEDLSFLSQKVNRCDERFFEQPVGAYFALDVKSICERLETVSPFRQRNPSVLLHGDYWPGNILWRDHALVGVVDWEDAALGDPLIDFAISRLDILWIFGVDVMQSFTHRYRSLMDIDYTDLPYWDLCAALRLARLIGTDLPGWTAFFVPYGRRDITEDTFRKHYQFFVTQAFEKLTA